MISGLIDYVLNKDYLHWTIQDEQELIDLAAQMNLPIHDSEAFLAYWKFSVKPSLGTEKVLEYVVQLAGFDQAHMREWFEYKGFPFHFIAQAFKLNTAIIDFSVTYDFLHNLILQYKNERSYFEALELGTEIRVNLPFTGGFSLGGEDTTIYDGRVASPGSEPGLKDSEPIWEVPTILTILTGSPIFPSGQQGVLYSRFLEANAVHIFPDVANWVVTSGSLPTNLSLDPLTGEIYGTPTIVETQTFTVQINDSFGIYTTKSFSLSIVA